MKRRVVYKLVVLAAASLLLLTVSACAKKGVAVDPGQWGYDYLVTYDALGGMVNAREIRKTYYLPNSYVFRPSGSSNMLVEPARDGYVLAGWYTDKSEKTEGSNEEYSFSGADRWDFNTDRVQGDMTLYARWLPRGKVDYVNADTGEVIFSKNITSDSPIQPLSDSVMDLRKPDGVSFAGYFVDAACTQEYDFSAYSHVDPNPTEAQLYAALCEMFPQYIEPYEYIEPEEDAEDSVTDTSWLFLNKLGYRLLTEDEAALQEIADAKDALLETAIQTYLTNTASRVVYLKFMDGNYIRVRSAKDLKHGVSYGFFDTDAKGNPIDGYNIEGDIDLSGVTLTMSERFSGVINGNGYALNNLSVSIVMTKIDRDKEKFVGLVSAMEGATINDLTIGDASLVISINPGINVTAGLLAATAKDVTLNRCKFNGLSVDTGRGDTGKARYTFGDLFGTFENCTFNDCAVGELSVSAHSPESIRLALYLLPAPEIAEPGETEPAVQP